MPATITTLGQFTNAPAGSLTPQPFGNLISDSSRDFVGTALDGAETRSGLINAVFEVADTPGGATVEQSVLPTNVDGEGLVADSNGDLLGPTEFGASGFDYLAAGLLTPRYANGKHLV
jgi:hypothetical protein